MKLAVTTCSRRPVSFPSRAIGLAIACSLLASGCNSTGSNEKGGQLIGAVAGGGLGAVLGGKTKGKAGTVIGGLIGAGAGYLIGGQIGRYLDDEDRKRASEATAAALDKSYNDQGKPATSAWTSDKNQGVAGETTAKGTGKGCFATQEIAIVPGQGTVRQENTYCRKNGRWEAA